MKENSKFIEIEHYGKSNDWITSISEKNLKTPFKCYLNIDNIESMSPVNNYDVTVQIDYLNRTNKKISCFMIQTVSGVYYLVPGKYFNKIYYNSSRRSLENE